MLNTLFSYMLIKLVLSTVREIDVQVYNTVAFPLDNQYERTTSMRGFISLIGLLEETT